MAEFWQKKPLLIRQALPGFQSPISPDEIAGLACEPDVESRLVLEKDGRHPWELRHGPFRESEFAALPSTHWTLLVQEVNKHVPPAAALLDEFRFIPNWRIDDIMVSFAPQGGSVGPHFDSYDTFLLQTQGHRRWQVNARPGPDPALLPDLELAVLADFRPEQEWTLGPGDMLYVPPGVAHYGVALEDCQTWSIGFRAPTELELLNAFADYLAANANADVRYADPDLALQSAPGEITPGALAQVTHSLTRLLETTDPAEWFGRFVTENRTGPGTEPRASTIEVTAFRESFKRRRTLLRSELSRFAHVEHGAQGATLFVDGDALALPAGSAFAAPLITGQREFHYHALEDSLRIPEFAALLTRLYNDGHVVFSD